MNKNIDVVWLGSKIENPTIREITLQLTTLINSGEIAVGSILPPVRELALELGISPATVSAVWSILRKHKMIIGAGRQGITVLGNNTLPSPARFSKLNGFGDHIIADLTYSVPDPLLLPDLSQAMTHAVKAKDLNSYQREPIIKSLETVARSYWPYQADAFMATNGGFEALYFLLKTIILPGSIVAVEDPTALRILDILDSLEATIIPIPCDDEGPNSNKLAEVLAKKPVAFIYQPRTHSICGHTVSKQRFQQMVKVFKSSKTLIIEDDGIGDLSSRNAVSLGQYYPERTVYIRSYSKAYGPDLRLAILSAPAKIIETIQDYRNYSAGWTSRLLQEALAWLINDPETCEKIKYANQIYTARRLALVNTLKTRGINTPNGDGLSLWIAVPSEQFALITLAAKGFAVIPSQDSSINCTNHIRIGTSTLKSELVDSLADTLVIALKPPRIFR